MVLNDAGISAGWQIEWMPHPRRELFVRSSHHRVNSSSRFFPVMSEGTLLPDGKVLIINGCRTGTAGARFAID
jgi:hypothetical protein